MDFHGISLRKPVRTFGSRSRYIGQLAAIWDWTEGGRFNPHAMPICSPQQMIDDIIDSGTRGINLLRDVVKADDFFRVENTDEPIHNNEVEAWYIRQWSQIRCNLLVVNACKRFGGKREYAAIIGQTYNKVNGWCSFRDLISNPRLIHALKICAKITDSKEYGKTFRTIYEGATT
jgi:hypothetical protein